MPTLEPAVRWQRVRTAAALGVGAALLLGLVLAAPGTSQATATKGKPAAVVLKTLPISAGLPIAPKTSAPAGLPTARAAFVPARVTPVTLAAGTAFTMAGVVCATPRLAGAVVVRLRASPDGVSWGRWQEAELEQNSHPGRAAESFIDPLWTGPARYLQVSARAGTEDAPLALADVRVVVIDSLPAGGAAAAVNQAPVATTSSASPSPTPSATATPSATPTPAPATEPVIVTRQQWGADESLRKGAPSYAPVKMAFVHHTDTGNDYTEADGPAIVRAIYAYHTQTLGWNDIGYNFLIDRYGTIYEGRYGGVTRGVIGAQVLGFNTGSTGIAMIGTFTDVVPPPAAMTALESLLAWKLSLSHLDPLATATMTCGVTQKFKAGAKVTLPVIAGHRDANFTDCPGNALYALLPTVRSAVARLLDPQPWRVTLQLSAASVAAGRPVTYSGSVATATGKAGSGTVTIQRQPISGGGWSGWRTARLSAHGSYSLKVPMTSSSAWRVRAKMPGTDGALTGYSPVQTLTVRRAPWRVTLGLSTTATPSGSTVRCRGTVTTATGHPGTGAVRLQRRLASGGEWSTWRTAPLGAAGRYATSVAVPRRDRWSVRARMLAQIIHERP